jgi:hypothetical protein
LPVRQKLNFEKSNEGRKDDILEPNVGIIPSTDGTSVLGFDRVFTVEPPLK